jgi:diguanylate cyclase (GGDEF)-like protein
MEQQLRIDASSGLFPQAMLETLLAHEVARSRRYPDPIALLYFALRFPKDPTTDIIECSRTLIANHLHASMREADLPGHYEGNYMVIMPSTDTEGAKVAAQRMLDNFPRSQVTRTAQPFELSMCIGVVSHKGGPDLSVAQLLSNASSALWEAERTGPTSLAVYGESVPKKG